MKNLKYFFIAVFAISLFSMQAFAQKKQDVEKVKKQIEKMNASFDESASKGDAKGMTKGYSSDAILYPPNSPEAKGSDAGAKVWQSYLDMGKAVVKIDNVKIISFSGNTAVATHTYQLEITMKDGKVIKDNGKGLAVYKEQKDGSWLITNDMWNSNLPVPGSTEKK